MSDQNYIDVYTGAYTTRAHIILVCFKQTWLKIENLSNNIDLENFTEIRPEIRPDYSVVWSISKNKRYTYLTYNKLNTNHDQIKKWLAEQLIECVHALFLTHVSKHIKWHNFWKRDSTYKFKEFSDRYITNEYEEKLDNDITVADIYCLCDLLSGTHNIHELYSEEQLDRVVGKKKDPVETEFIRAKHLEYVKLYNDYEDDRKKRLDEYEAKIKEETRRLNVELQEDYKKIKEEFEVKMKKLNSSFGLISPSITTFPREKVLYDIHRETFDGY